MIKKTAKNRYCQVCKAGPYTQHGLAIHENLPANKALHSATKKKINNKKHLVNTEANSIKTEINLPIKKLSSLDALVDKWMIVFKQEQDIEKAKVIFDILVDLKTIKR